MQSTSDIDINKNNKYIGSLVHNANISEMEPNSPLRNIKITHAEKFTGGQSNPTYVIYSNDGRFVLRRKPFGVLLKSAHAIDREFMVPKALRTSVVPVANMFHYCKIRQ
jgi:hypothetical protein